MFSQIVDNELENTRMDRYLKKICPNESMSRIYQSLKKRGCKSKR